ncbi:MAG: site-specific integrase [Proteobacteria bacterium]|nr:site-specific integrase [Pseudomonadota bacterium]
MPSVSGRAQTAVKHISTAVSMPSIQRLTSPRSGRISYRVQVRLKGHPSQSETFRTYKDAARWAASVESAILERRHFPHTRARRINFDALVCRYRGSVLMGASARRRATAERHLAWWFGYLGTLPLADITPDRIAEGRDLLASQVCTRRRGARNGEAPDGAPGTYQRSGATVNRYVSTLSHLLAVAATEWRLLDANPARAIGRKKEPGGRTRFLSDAERAALLDACAASAWPALQALVLLAITTGARRSELIRLRWSDVALGAPLPQAIVHHTKNGDPRRLPLVGRALEAVKQLNLEGRTGGPFVFAHPRDANRPYEAFDAHWYRARAAAALGDFRFHDLRHTCASYLASQGASLLEIADVLGHRTLAMVKRYSHLAQSHKVTVIRKMARKRGL